MGNTTSTRNRGHYPNAWREKCEGACEVSFWCQPRVVNEQLECGGLQRFRVGNFARILPHHWSTLAPIVHQGSSEEASRALPEREGSVDALPPASSWQSFDESHTAAAPVPMMRGQAAFAHHTNPTTTGGPGPGAARHDMSVILVTGSYDHEIRFWEAWSSICSRTIARQGESGVSLYSNTSCSPERELRIQQVNRLAISPEHVAVHLIKPEPCLIRA